MRFLSNAANSISYYLKYFNRASSQDHILLLASGLSFSVLTCIIPLVLILFSLLGILLSRPQIENDIGVYVSRIIPYGAEAEFVKRLIVERAEEFKIYKNLAGYSGVIGMMLMASGLFGSIRTILNRTYKVAASHPIWRGKIKDLGFLLMVIAYFLISVTILPTSEALLKSAGNFQLLTFLRIDAMTSFFLSAITFVVAFVSLCTIYWMIPQQQIPAKVVFFSALVAAILWQIANQLFGYYIGHFFTLKNVYGAYSLIVVVAVWIYYTSVIFIIGATSGQAYREKYSP